MNATRFHRAVRKLIRPVRRRLLPKGASSSLEELSGGCLVLIAHPDDEVFCSGLICELLEGGEPVHLVSFTRGEGGERVDVSKEANLGQVREEELRKASASLGVSSLTFLDYKDPEASDGTLNEPSHDSAELLAELEALLKKHEVAHLVTHGSSGEYWHPAHLCLHRHSRNLNRRLSRLTLWTFNAWTAPHPLQAVLNQDDPPNLTLDASSHHERRLQSLACHRSQRLVFERFGKGSLNDFISKTAIESYRKW